MILLLHECFNDRYLTTRELGYNNIGLCDNSFITSYIIWYQIIPQKRVFFCLD